MKIGVLMAFGTDAAGYPQGMNAEETGDYVDLGMTPAAALMTSSRGLGETARRVDAETRNHRSRQHADIVAVPGDVLKNIRATEPPAMVMKHGMNVALN